MSSPPKEEQYGSHIGRVARGAGISFFGQGVGRTLGYATQIALARMYGPASLGLYVLGTAAIEISNILAQFGMDNGVVRYVARYRNEGDIARMRGMVLLAFWASLLLSVALGALIFFGAGFLADEVFDEPFLEPLLKAFSASLPFLTIMSMALWAIQGFQTVKYPTYVRQVFQPIANLSLIIVFYLLGAQILGAVAAYVASMALGAVLSIFCLKRVFPEVFDRRIPAKYEAGALFSASGPMIVANVTQYLYAWIAVAILGVFATAEAVGIYHAANRTAGLSSVVLFAFAGIFGPMASSLHGSGSLEHLGSLYKDVSRWTFTASLAIFLLTAFLATDIMAVFGEAFVAGWPAMLLIAGAQLFNSSVGLTGRILAMTGHQKVVMVATVGATVVAVGASFALVPFYGLMGAAIATAIAIVFSNLATLFSVNRLLGFWPYDRLYMKPVIAGALAAAAAYLCKLALPLPPGIPTILALAPLFMLAFAGILLALGIGPSDRQFLGAFWAAIRRAARRPDRNAPPE